MASFYELLPLSVLVSFLTVRAEAVISPMMMPVIEGFDAKCSKNGIAVELSFTGPFNGVVYSKGHFSNPDCRYNSYQPGTSMNFTIPIETCGTLTSSSNGKTTIENVIVIQNEVAVQELWDTSKKIVCDLSGSGSPAKVKDRFRVSMLDSEEVRVPGEFGVAMIKMKILQGEWPNVSNLTSLVKIGEPMTVCVEVGSPGLYDTAIRNCVAYDSEDMNAVTTNSLRLTDDNGCPLKTKLFGEFSKQPSASDNHTHVSIFNAFTFPDQMDVFICCEVEFCKGKCGSCSQIEPALDNSAPTPVVNVFKPFTTTSTTSTTRPCVAGDPRLECPLVCTPEYTDIRCSCGEGDTRDKCAVKTTSTTTTMRPCVAGDPRPECPLVCTSEYTDARCPCREGDTRDKCAVKTTTPGCKPGSECDTKHPFHPDGWAKPSKRPSRPWRPDSGRKRRRPVRDVKKSGILTMGRFRVGRN